MNTGRPRFATPKANLRAFAKDLRGNQTPAERKLWRALRECVVTHGSHFRRQVVRGNYIVDFCSQGCRLIIEVDGNQHGEDAALVRDSVRDEFLSHSGYRVLRFSNRDVMTEITSVLDTILAALQEPFSERSVAPHP